jgi:predicted nuclease with TOPRIM domain
MTPEDKVELRAVVFEAVTSAMAGFQRHFDEQHREMRADVELMHDSLDRLIVEMGAVRTDLHELAKKVDRIDAALNEVKAQVVSLNRKQLRDVDHEQRLRTRLDALEIDIALIKKELAHGS